MNLSEEENQEEESSKDSDDTITIIEAEDKEILEKKPPNYEILEFYVPDEGAEESLKQHESTKVSESSEKPSESE